MPEDTKASTTHGESTNPASTPAPKPDTTPDAPEPLSGDEAARTVGSDNSVSGTKPASAGATSVPQRPSAPGGSASIPPPAGAAWALPLKRFLDEWTRVETYLCVAVVLAEIFALCAWVVLKGLGTPKTAGTSTGAIVRAVLGAVVLGIAAYFATRKKSLLAQRITTSAAILAGLLGAGLWTDIGVAYFANILNWLQDSSSLTLIGGLRGLGTRLTIWLAMLGGSLAAASGKHIHIDVVMRFVPRKARVGATLVTWAGASLVCFTAAWGFVDHIAIESFDVDRGATVGAKFTAIGHHAGQGAFVLRKQLALDLSTLPVVLAGKRYDSWLSNDDWNRRIQDAGWEDHFTPEQVATLKMPADVGKEFRLPVVMVPGSTHVGLLKHFLNLVFPFGFLIIGIRFLLRGVLAIAGHVNVDPDAAHADVVLPTAKGGGPDTASAKQGAA